jgi:hypothetical protein
MGAGVVGWFGIRYADFADHRSYVGEVRARLKVTDATVSEDQGISAKSYLTGNAYFSHKTGMCWLQITMKLGDGTVIEDQWVAIDPEPEVGVFDMGEGMRWAYEGIKGIEEGYY